jgi:hypothetical protein
MTGWAGRVLERRTWFHLLGFLVGAGLLASRGPDRLWQPELWAEDGAIWLQQAYNLGPPSLAMPMTGYLQSLSRLTALLAVHLPLTYAPSIFAWTAFALQIAPAALLLSSRGEALIGSLTVRLLLVLYYVGGPNAAEVYINLTNAMWHLALLAFLLVVLPKPRTGWGLGAEAALLVLAGLSGPLVLFIAPIAWWHGWAERREPGNAGRVFYAALLSVCGALQGALVAAQLADGRLGHLGANFNRFAHIFADQIILGGMLGSALVWRLLTHVLWQDGWAAGGVCVIAAAMGLAAFIKGPNAYRQLVVLSVLIMASALKSPMVTSSGPQWEQMQYPGIGDRYYIIPMLAWFSTLLVLASGNLRFGLHWVARLLVLCCAIGVVGDWYVSRYVPTGYHDAAKRFDRASPGTVVTFPENPTSWKFDLTKR